MGTIFLSYFSTMSFHDVSIQSAFTGEWNPRNFLRTKKIMFFQQNTKQMPVEVLLKGLTMCRQVFNLRTL